MNYDKHLKDLRNKLARGHMSLLVGAGFSKNVHHSFLSWDELLYDLTKELYQNEIDSAFNQHLKTGKRFRLSFDAFTKQFCKDITTRIGYLEVVSEYIRIKGYPEVIATYIEERTPSIRKAGKDYELSNGNNTIPIKAEKLSLHRKIIELPWNNIYTTNYDELLDCCIDEGQVNQLRQEIEELEDDNNALYKERDDVLYKLQAFQDEITEPKSSTSEFPIDIAGKISDEKDEVEDKPKLEKEVERIEARLKDNEQTIKEKEGALLSRYHVVRSAGDLRLKRTKNIIKLHGSLRTTEQKAKYYFQFDSDPHKQYVISKDDYETYREKHEAFTQLMRIALLQESFCLIGFSGVDPNFKAWVNWVKDILHKEAIKNKQTQYKIYLIDVGAAEISVDQQLFFENHSIIRIPLRSAEVTAFLNSENDIKLKISDPRTAIQALLLFLEGAEFINPEISQLDLSVESKRNKVWNDFKVYDFQKKPDTQILQQTLANLQNIEGKIWIANLNHANTHNQHSLINYVNYHAWKAYLQEDDQDHTLKQLVILALKDYYLPIKNFIEADVLNMLREALPTKNDVANLLRRNESLEVGESTNISEYESILRLAYSFRFDELKEALEKWNPEGKFIIAKLSFLGIYDSESASDQLNLTLEEDNDLIEEEILYGYELLHFLRSTHRWPADKKIKRAIRNYEKAGFQTLQDKFEYLEEQAGKNRNKPEPFGEDRYSTTRQMHFGSHTNPELALQYLMLLAETGFQLMLRRTYRVSSESWYNLFIAGYEHYPHAFLFYSLQYGDEKFLKRIGQDYAYSESDVRKEINVIAKRLMQAYPTAPDTFQNHILTFLSKMLISVPAEIWQDGFLTAWNLLKDEGSLFKEPGRFPYLRYFTSNIPFIKNKEILLSIVRDSLQQIQQGETDQAISYLFYLNKNFHYDKIGKEELDQPLIDLMNSTIQNLSNGNDSLIFVLGNIHLLLTDRQIQSISTHLQDFDYKKVRHPRAWHIFLYFIDNDAKLKEILKKALLDSKGMWHTGIDGNTVSMGGNNLIELRRISFSDSHPKGIVWTDAEVKELFQKLKLKLPGLQLHVGKREDMKFSFTDVLEEMYWFLKTFSDILSSELDFTSDLNLVTRLYHADRNYTKLEEGLINDDHSTVVWSLGELSRLVYQNTATNKQINIVLYKVLLQTHPSLEAAISYLAAWSKTLLKNPEFSSIKSVLIEILKRYKENPFLKSEVAFVEEQLVTIANNLSKVGETDEVILWWQERGRKSVYNNIKLHLLKSEDENIVE